MDKHLVDISLLKELDNKATFIRENAVDSDSSTKDYIVEEANQHSARIERPKAILYDPNVDNQAKLAQKRGLRYFIESLQNSWKYGSENLTLPLEENLIKSLAARIDPTYFEEYSEEMLETDMAPYRRITEAVRPSGARHTPPYPAKVPLEMQRLIEGAGFLYKAISIGKIHPVELAAYTHFHLTRIHPFPDVNGRTSRMVQNLILNNQGFPVAVLPEGERRSYHILLDNAHIGYRSRNRKDPFEVSDQERQFYTFVADKVNVSLDKILDKSE